VAASPISRSAADAAPNHEGEYKSGVDTVDDGSKEEKATTGELEDFKIDLNTKTADVPKTGFDFLDDW